MDTSSLGDRIKGYESASEQVLPNNIPVIIRLDGSNFSKLTDQYFDKPFDERFESAMNQAALSVMKYCSGAQIALVQSDEVNILLRNDQRSDFDPFLSNRTQKLASLTASKASVAFNTKLRELNIEGKEVFDSRAFVVPKSEVLNVFIWRQEDAFKNCVSSIAYFGLKEKYGTDKANDILYEKDLDERQEIIFQELGKNVNNVTTSRKRGRLIYKVKEKEKNENYFSEEKYEKLLTNGYIESGGYVVRSKWKIDNDPPRLTSDDALIKDLVFDDG